jgi:putative membrane protein
MDSAARPGRHVLHGLVMGAADAVPGVSGGTMALIMGIYEQLLTTISQGFQMILAVVRGNGARAAEQYRSIHWSFILPLVAGIAVAIGIASIFVPDLLERYPTESRALFLGLVGASIAIPWNRIPNPGYQAVATAFAFAVPAFFLSGLPSGTVEDPALWMAFAGAAVAICAMILPGVSGSFLLLVLGLYEPTLEAVRDLDLAYVAVFALGAIAGLGSFATLLRRLLTTNHDRTMAALVGLMLGSLRALWPWQDDDRNLLGPDDTALAVLALVVIGFVIVTIIQRSGSRSRHPATRS